MFMLGPSISKPVISKYVHVVSEIPGGARGEGRGTGRRSRVAGRRSQVAICGSRVAGRGPGPGYLPLDPSKGILGK